MLDCASRYVSAQALLLDAFVDPLLGPDPTPASLGSTYILTGETGAGKSILVDAIELLVDSLIGEPAPSRAEVRRALQRAEGNMSEAARLAGIMREEDRTRPVSAGFNGESSGYNGFQHVLDAIGYNYRMEGFQGAVLGVIAIFCSTTNIVSGFLITDRMLKMFKTDAKPSGGAQHS